MSNLQTAERIQKLSKAKGITQSFLCKQIGVAHNYFHDLKNGKTTIREDRLVQIAGLLDTSVEYLTGETDDPSVSAQTEKAATLSDDRQELLNIYDSLSPEMQKILLAQVKAMSAASEE